MIVTIDTCAAEILQCTWISWVVLYVPLSCTLLKSCSLHLACCDTMVTHHTCAAESRVVYMTHIIAVITVEHLVLLYTHLSGLCQRCWVISLLLSCCLTSCADCLHLQIFWTDGVCVNACVDLIYVEAQNITGVQLQVNVITPIKTHLMYIVLPCLIEKDVNFQSFFVCV